LDRRYKAKLSIFIYEKALAGRNVNHMILEILSEIGEGCSIGIGLIILFAIPSFLFSKRKLNVKHLIILLSGIFCACIGIFFGEYISETWAYIGGFLFFPIGIAIGFNLTG
jgi:hypothetical protein